MTALARIVGLFLVDPRGWVLLQERDEHAPIAPDQWGIVGGHVEDGEEWLPARDRELVEETGLVLADGAVDLWFHGVVEHHGLAASHEWKVWVGQVHLTDADIVCGEGRRIVFVDPATFGSLDASESLAYFLPRLLASRAYAAIRTGTSREGSRDPAS